MGRDADRAAGYGDDLLSSHSCITAELTRGASRGVDDGDGDDTVSRGEPSRPASRRGPVVGVVSSRAR